MPQRTAHEVVGKLVRKALDRSVRLIDLTDAELKEADGSLDGSLRSALGVENAIARFVSYGSTAPREVDQQIASWKQRLQA
jgi:argininosuccinate lyase